MGQMSVSNVESVGPTPYLLGSLRIGHEDLENATESSRCSNWGSQDGCLVPTRHAATYHTVCRGSMAELTVAIRLRVDIIPDSFLEWCIHPCEAAGICTRPAAEHNIHSLGLLATPDTYQTDADQWRTNAVVQGKDGLDLRLLVLFPTAFPDWLCSVLSERTWLYWYKQSYKALLWSDYRTVYWSRIYWQTKL